ncbi:hypothetical protein [Nocardia sp. NPDC057455]|uniref:hypothetical protein n=1 Tax=Nocardia sp. NPDC057455 TaxID=3346138 RepID=UPI00366B85A0
MTTFVALAAFAATTLSVCCNSEANPAPSTPAASSAANLAIAPDLDRNHNGIACESPCSGSANDALRPVTAVEL